MKFSNMLLIFFICFISMAVYSQNHQNQNNNNNNINTSADNALLIRIKEKLAGLEIPIGKIDIEVKNGIVTINGPVISAAQKTAIVQAIKGVNGVKSIKSDHLTIKTNKVDTQPNHEQ